MCRGSGVHDMEVWVTSLEVMPLWTRVREPHATN